MSKTLDIESKLDNIKFDIQKLLEAEYEKGLSEGFELSKTKQPSQAQFKKDHAEPMTYGEDTAYVVYSTSRKKAAELLECDVDAVEGVYIDWRAYVYDGEATVGYYISHASDGDYKAYGVWL